MTRLYYVRDDSDIQYNKDLFVEAKTERIGGSATEGYDIEYQGKEV